MFTVGFHNATTTPFQPGLRQLVEAALSECGAERTGLEAEWRLSDGSALYLFGEEEEHGMLAEYPHLTPAVTAAIFAILRFTHTFLLDGEGQGLVRALGGIGDPRGTLIHAPWIEEVDEDGLHDRLGQIRPNTAAPTPAASSAPRRKASSSILDLLFGKAV